MLLPRMLRAVSVLFFCSLVGVGRCCWAAAWLPYGPDGGDARTFAADPTNHSHLYLGTANGWIYETVDAGGRWKRLARVGKRDDLVLDTILVDPANPKHVTVGAWVLDHADGGIYQSQDGGTSWSATADMEGQSIRSLAGAASDPKIIVAGTLTGVFRSADAGQHWARISPPANTEIHEVQSLAINPVDPQVIYAGTWHLPWKTSDGGETWEPMKKGIIDDSDVFSIIIDPQDPAIVFASACSGIYKSVDKGEEFHKVQGIPNTARRTLVLMQDPQQRNIVFAGTTEGLWRTEDAGKTWARMTGPEVIVNDVSIDPTDSQRILLATDRGGVLASTDGGVSFAPSNRGFSARQITAFVGDGQKAGTLYAGVVNDKEWGGVFMSPDGGLSWTQRSEGLSGRDVFSLAQAGDGTLLAGTAHGIFRLQDEGWTRVAGEVPVVKAKVVAPRPVVRPVPHLDDRSAVARTSKSAPNKGRAAPPRKTRTVAKEAAKNSTIRRPAPRSTVLGRARTAAAPLQEAKSPAAGSHAVGEGVMAVGALDGTVHAMLAVGDTMFAATSRGVLSGDAAGRAWHVVAALGEEEWRFLAGNEQTVVTANLGAMMLSNDGGQSWSAIAGPAKVSQITGIAVDGRGELWVGGREGVYLSSDKGMSWQTLKNLYVRDVDSLYYDPRGDQVMVTSGTATVAFAVEVATRKVMFWDTGWTLRFMRPVGDHLVGATLFDGIVVQPQMVEAKGAGGM